MGRNISWTASSEPIGTIKFLPDSSGKNIVYQSDPISGTSVWLRNEQVISYTSEYNHLLLPENKGKVPLIYGNIPTRSYHTIYITNGNRFGHGSQPDMINHRALEQSTNYIALSSPQWQNSDGCLFRPVSNYVHSYNSLYTLIPTYLQSANVTDTSIKHLFGGFSYLNAKSIIRRTDTTAYIQHGYGGAGSATNDFDINCANGICLYDHSTQRIIKSYALEYPTYSGNTKIEFKNGKSYFNVVGTGSGKLHIAPNTMNVDSTYITFMIIGVTDTIRHMWPAYMLITDFEANTGRNCNDITVHLGTTPINVTSTPADFVYKTKIYNGYFYTMFKISTSFYFHRYNISTGAAAEVISLTGATELYNFFTPDETDGTRFQAVGSSAANAAKCWNSTNGSSWTTGSGFNNTNAYYDISYNAGATTNKWIGWSPGQTYYMTSTDGLSWTERGFTYRCWGITPTPTGWLSIQNAAGSQGYIASCTDGVNWSTVATLSSSANVGAISGNGVNEFVAIRDTVTSGQFWTSTDGTNWASNNLTVYETFTIGGNTSYYKYLTRLGTQSWLLLNPSYFMRHTSTMTTIGNNRLVRKVISNVLNADDGNNTASVKHSGYYFQGLGAAQGQNSIIWRFNTTNNEWIRVYSEATSYSHNDVGMQFCSKGTSIIAASGRSPLSGGGYASWLVSNNSGANWTQVAPIFNGEQLSHNSDNTTTVGTIGCTGTGLTFIPIANSVAFFYMFYDYSLGCLRAVYTTAANPPTDLSTWTPVPMFNKSSYSNILSAYSLPHVVNDTMVWIIGEVIYYSTDGATWNSVNISKSLTGYTPSGYGPIYGSNGILNYVDGYYYIKSGTNIIRATTIAGLGEASVESYYTTSNGGMSGYTTGFIHKNPVTGMITSVRNTYSINDIDFTSPNYISAPMIRDYNNTIMNVGYVRIK